MVFSSLTFLCVFLPVVFLLALLIRKTRWQNVMLMVASLLFYAYGEPAYVLLMVVISVMSYGFGRAIGATEKPSARKLYAGIAILVALGCLGVFKYAEWFTGMLGQLIDESMAIAGIALPVGISFYTFQAISYIIDVYRKDVEPQRNLLHVVLYISFFPQLIAGPIIRYHDVDQQLTHRTITWEGVHVGLKRFIVGLAKKVLIADVLAVAVDGIFGADMADVTAPAAWLAAFAYLLQIYFDFSAYSDMAIGIARMFGFTYLENFNYPFTSTSIQEFWRKWHISLSTWFKEYLYIPLGGNRKGRPRTVLNKLTIFFCCGLWHGAAWTFVIWGLIHGFFLLLEEYLPIRKLPKPLGWLYAMMVVMLAFVLFRADTIEQGLYFLGQMFTGWGALSAQAEVLLAAQITPLFLFTLVLGAVGSFPWLPKLKERIMQQPMAVQKRMDALASVACVALLLVCLLTLAGGAYSPFIYFRF
ncbi:MBOAT family protein [uncultured Adlercreutzia sp.]|uniref:MBOAT family O-acyltransferase n=1 Tax=uncultured Adlercreutzia sp. TaxID=875803 RepID=UPI0025CF3E80|nr:MBOAT family protein [uncultured Adlercreutzia sp.]MCI9261443.1 MBOAT family protein [Eggerthellaceae bacterium]